MAVIQKFNEDTQLMKIHKEGHRIVFITAVICLLAGVAAYLFLPVSGRWAYLIIALLLILFGGVVYFFRHPRRLAPHNPRLFLSPADGTVVVVDKAREEEFFDKPMQQISVFMSPLNVHLNRYPVDARVIYKAYHPGSFLVAWHPKSSLHNERMTIVFETRSGLQFMVRQIAGVVARRIVCYSKEGEEVTQGGELGFIKFGSRVDVFLPEDAAVNVKPGDKVKGGLSALAELDTSED